MPFWAFSGNEERATREYFGSLANLCHYYQLAIPETDLPFPRNIYHTWEKIEKQVRNLDVNNHCMIMQDSGKKAVIAVVKTFDLSQCLFYIPVRSYWLWSQCAEQQRITELLTVIFAYLHQVVDIPFYAENGTFMDYQYDTLEQWVGDIENKGNTDEEEKEWREEQENTLYELRRAGGHIMPVIKNPYWLRQMETVITNYRHRDNWELEWELLAIEFLQLYRQYPKRSLPDCIHQNLIYPDEDERITPYQYTSFYWSGKDCFVDELNEMINCSLQEIAVMDEPTAVYLFDKLPNPDQKEFDFETRLFDLMERLRNLLNDYDHEEHHPTL
ncbi:hypothetical protein [Mucilaginibacter segetis]|uniref:Uncharacterized protein n=1 Tax=Mucilaginibacter segetis TaxID=2793071 RepID=A0A934UMY8_9SPHI|nr:hypothetical protein [Mucilaginibacter segetis]MBK0379372.1 hypothetical protein [Mucilaginibacter segetis]